jgi:hypothetical protein
MKDSSLYEICVRSICLLPDNEGTYDEDIRSVRFRHPALRRESTSLPAELKLSLSLMCLYEAEGRVSANEIWLSKKFDNDGELVMRAPVCLLRDGSIAFLFSTRSISISGGLCTGIRIRGRNVFSATIETHVSSQASLVSTDLGRLRQAAGKPTRTSRDRQLRDI